MTEMKALGEDPWVPQACTLPTVERPLRLAEFDELFASAVVGVERVDRLRVRLELRPEPTVAGTWLQGKPGAARSSPSP
ncbi:hypothetical protein ACWD6N_11205 [Micromonospora sp. NPDC005163]